LIDEDHDVAYLSVRRHLRRHGDQHSLALDERYQSQAPMIGSTRAMRYRLYRILMIAWEIVFFASIIFLESHGFVEWGSSRFTRRLVAGIWAAILLVICYALWMIYIGPEWTPAVAGVLLGIVGGLFLHRVVLVLKTLPLLPEKIRAWIQLRSLTRRGGPVHMPLRNDDE
jgi:hypothetical protein